MVRFLQERKKEQRDKVVTKREMGKKERERENRSATIL